MATPAKISAALFFGCFLLYLANGDVTFVNDAAPATYLPSRVLGAGSLTFTPEANPYMFYWEAGEGEKSAVVWFPSWDHRLGSRPARDWLAAGRLKVSRPEYYLGAARGAPDRYLTGYGPVAGLCGVPLAAVARPFTRDTSSTLWTLGKISASALAAGSALFLYWTALARLSRPKALWLAAAYAAGTCVWSVLSQALWQQTPVVFFLSLGAWLFLKEPRRPWTFALCGAALGAAFVGRSTSALVVAAAGAYLLWTDRKAAFSFALGAAAPILLSAVYYLTLWGSAFGGQSHALGAAPLALAKTGSPDVWQTPLWLGAAGILLSPSRGLLVFSPFLAFAAWGFVRSVRRPEWRPFLPFGIAAGGMLLVSFKWFDWWGGWSFGYRLVVDVVPLLALLLIPVADTLLSCRAGRAAAGALAGWSVLAQILGAFAYEPHGWNARSAGFVVKVPGEAVERRVATREEASALVADRRAAREVTLDVDQREHRWRLWSVADSQLVYLLTRFSESRAEKRRTSRLTFSTLP
ncbi:MAG TPA: glycosyltransferase family 39 protein [Planctomycetota bacterium]